MCARQSDANGMARPIPMRKLFDNIAMPMLP